MSAPPPDDWRAALVHIAWCQLGAIGYAGWALRTAGKLPAGLADSMPRRSASLRRRGPTALRAAFDAVAADMQSLLRLAEHGSERPRPTPTERAREGSRFCTSTGWPLAPLRHAMNGRSQVLRYARRGALALLVGYNVGLHLPWSVQPQWIWLTILLTIAVVMRTNLAQTVERRNARPIGTALAAGMANGFVQVRYLIAATSATVLALIQGHLLHTAGEFAPWERLADTLIGTALAWAFSDVLPAWERCQLPVLLARLRTAQLQHAQAALTGTESPSASAHRALARREVLDCLAAIALAAQRARSEPCEVRPSLELIEQVQLRSERLLAQFDDLRMGQDQLPTEPDPNAAPMFAPLARSTAALPPLPSSPIDRAPTTGRMEPVDVRDEASGLHRSMHQRLRDATSEASALGADLAAAHAWEAARLQRKQR